MICLAIILLFFAIAPFILDKWYVENEQEKNVDALAIASMKQKKRRKYTWPSPGTGKPAGK